MKYWMRLAAITAFAAGCSGNDNNVRGVTNGETNGNSSTPDMASSTADSGNNEVDTGADMGDAPPEGCRAAHVAGLPEPGGAYCVGVSTVVLTDTSRMDPITDAATRDVVARFWYPTTTSTGDAYNPIDPTTWSRFELPATPQEWFANAIVDAPIAAGTETFPVLIFMPGYSAPSGMYASWFEYFASRGWVVVALEHPGISTTWYPDGTIVDFTFGGSPEPADIYAFIQSMMPTLMADAMFARTSLADDTVIPIPADRLDDSRIAYFGHSLGGATSIGACENDDACVGSIDVDGSPFKGEPATFDVATKPIGFILGEGHTVDVDPFVGDVWGGATSTRFSAELAGVGHSGLTDLILVFPEFGEARPAEFAAPFGPPGSRAELEILDAVTRISETFFNAEVLDATDPAVGDVASEYSFVTFAE